MLTIPPRPPKRIAQAPSKRGIQIGDKDWNPPSSVESWSPTESYYQQALVPGMGEYVLPHHNPPEVLTAGSTPLGETATQLPLPGNEVADQLSMFASDVPRSGVDEIDWDTLLRNAHLKTGTRQSRFAKGFGKGWDYAVDKPWGFSRSVLWNRAPQDEYNYLDAFGQTGYLGGRIAGDILGEGSRSVVWRIHPLDLAGTGGMRAIGAAGGNRTAQILGMAAATNTLGITSGNMNYFNLDEAGRPSGFAATDPNEEDPRQTNNVALEYFNRNVLGRTGRLLPWAEFHQERPDVPYETYEAYKDYLYNPGILGIAKGTLDGVDGPEARIMGYRITPLGALAAAGVIGGGVLATKRFAGLRK
jgi:hypothetical protein